MENIIRLRSLDGTEYVVSGTMTIGRAPSCHIVIKHSEASRVHATIWIQHDSVYIQDKGSSNGTFVNEKRIEDVVPLQHGDVIRIGDIVFTLVSLPTDAPYPGATALSLEPDLSTVEPEQPPSGVSPMIKGRYLIIASCLILFIFICVMVVLITGYYFLR